jgi:acyl-CoA synthetase (AMP-forming)/AMP-acid ligase II
MNLAYCVEHQAARTPNSVAIEEDGGRQLTYRELDVRTNRIANMLAGLGVREGDRVAYYILNRLEAVDLMVACAKIGAVAAPLNFRLSEADLLGILSNARPAVVVTQSEFLDLVQGVSSVIGAQTICLGDEYEELLGAGSTVRPEQILSIPGDAHLLLQYTSGTTGRSKGAGFTHNAVLAHAANVALEYSIDSGSRVLVSVPHNSSTNIQIAPALYRGATVVMADVRSFDGERWVERVNRLGVTHSQVVPTMLYRVLDARARMDIAMPTLKCLGYGSAPIPAGRVEELIDIYGTIFVQLYGMIEVAAVGTMLRRADHEWALKEAPEVIGSVGQASYGMHVRVVDDTGNDVAPGERGEVAFNSQYMMTGYWDAPELTAETIRNGWLHSGDIGKFKDGWLYLVDRKKDLIIRGGQNIASKEIEDAFYAHPAVLEAAVVGVPEPEWGEEIVAVIMLKPGATATATELLDACAATGLARFKRPTRIDFVDELPRNTIGKVQKAILRNRYGTRIS